MTHITCERFMNEKLHNTDHAQLSSPAFRVIMQSRQEIIR